MIKRFIQYHQTQRRIGWHVGLIQHINEQEKCIAGDQVQFCPRNSHSIYIYMSNATSPTISSFDKQTISKLRFSPPLLF